MSESDPMPQTRVCRHCSVQSQVDGDFCPNCGRSYTRRGVSRKTKLIIVGVVAAILLAVGATGVVAKVRHDHSVNEARQAKADKAAAQAAAAARARAHAKAVAKRKADAKRAADNAERQQRHSAVKQMEQSITKDARKDVSNGVLDGPILYTSCDPLGGGSTDDLTALTTTFSCLAVDKKNGDGTVSGYEFHATQNWTTGSYSWGLGNN